MKHFWRSGVGLGLMLLTSTAVAQREQWLSYRTSREGHSYHWLDVTTNVPSGITLPEFNAQPHFVWWATPMDPAGGRWICLDRARKTGPYDRLYVDSNGDGKLDSEKPVDADRREAYYAYFPLVRLTFKGEDGPVTYHLLLRSYGRLNSSPELLLSSGGWYEGSVDVGGKRRKLQLLDGNLNGTFNDVATNSYDCDRVRIEGDKLQERFLARMLEVDGQLFRITAARDGAFVILQKAEGVAHAAVRVPPAISEFTAFGPNGHFMRKPDKGAFTLPEGDYQVMGWSIDRKDNKGVAWKMQGYGFPQSAAFKVASAEPASVKVGEPVRANFQAATRTNREMAFSLQFLGNMGERVQFSKAGEQARAPRLIVTNTAGTFNYTGNFEFG